MASTFGSKTISHAEFICTLPDWWDERGKWCVDPSGRIVIVHPDHEPMWFDGKWHQVSDEKHR